MNSFLRNTVVHLSRDIPV